MPMSRAGQDKSSCCDGLAAWALGREWSSGPALVPVGPDDRTHVKFGRRGRGGGGGCWQVHLSASWRPLDGSDLQRGDPWGVRKRASLSSETAVKTTTPSLPNGSSGRELAGQSPRRSEWGQQVAGCWGPAPGGQRARRWSWVQRVPRIFLVRTWRDGNMWLYFLKL